MKNKEQILKACEDSKRKGLGGRRQVQTGVLGQDEKFALSQCSFQVGREKVCSRFQSYVWEGLKGQSSMDCLQNAKVHRTVLWEQ